MIAPGHVERIIDTYRSSASRSRSTISAEAAALEGLGVRSMRGFLSAYRSTQRLPEIGFTLR